MNIEGIINDIENYDTITERCIGYSEVILYLKGIRASYVLIPETEGDWRAKVSNELINNMHKKIDTGIETCKNMIKSNVEYNKLI